MKGILFDLDGTLVNSLDDLADVMNRLLKSRGRKPFPLDDYRFMVGKGIRNLVEKVFPQEPSDAISEIQKEFVREYTLHLLDQTRPYEGITAVLAELKRRKIPMGVFTNKAEPQSVMVVETLFGRELFSFIRGAREGSPLKPDPSAVGDDLERLGLDPRETLFVGDSSVDMHTARNGGMFPCGVLWGYRDRAELEEAGAERIISRPEELLSFFTRDL